MLSLGGQDATLWSMPKILRFLENMCESGRGHFCPIGKMMGRSRGMHLLLRKGVSRWRYEGRKAGSGSNLDALARRGHASHLSDSSQIPTIFFWPHRGPW